MNRAKLIVMRGRGKGIGFFVNNAKMRRNPDTEPRDRGGGVGGRDFLGRWSPLLSAAGFFFLYLGFLSARYNFDGTVFGFWLEEALHTGHTGKLWHPRHLLYLPLSYALAKTLAAAGLKTSGVLFLQVLDAFVAGCVLFCFQVLCARLTGDRALSVVFTLLSGFSFGFWFFAVEPEVYMLHCLVLFAGFFLLLGLTEESSGEKMGWAFRSVLLGLVAAVAVASHVTGGLFLLPLGWAALFYLRPGSGSWIERLKRGLAPALVFSAVAILAGGALFFHGWTVNPLAKGQGVFGWVVGKFNPETGLGYRKSYWSFSWSSALDWLCGFQDAFIAGDGFQYQNGGSRVLPLLLTFGLVVCLLVYLVRLPRLIREEGRVQALLLLCFVPPALFSLFWEPRNLEIKSPLVPFFWLAAGIGAADLRKRAGRGFSKNAVLAFPALLAALLFYYNFTSSILPGSDHLNNGDLQRALFIREHTEPEAVIYIAGVEGGFKMGKIYLPYFARRQARVVDWILARSGLGFPEALEASLAADRARPVYVLSELLTLSPGLENLCRTHGIPPEAMMRFFTRFRLEETARREEGFALYRLTLNPQR